MNILEDFQPGDGTRYVMHLSYVEPGTSPLGSSRRGFAVLSILNMGHTIALPVDSHVFFDCIEDNPGWRKANPWTIRAALLFLKKESDACGWGMTFDMRGCPVE